MGHVTGSGANVALYQDGSTAVAICSLFLFMVGVFLASPTLYYSVVDPVAVWKTRLAPTLGCMYS